MATYDYKNLDVWQRSIDFVARVYKLTELLPDDERFGLISQARRSAVSIPSNIAEGQKRYNKGETAQFTYIALGSLAELETQLILMGKLYKLNVRECLIECEIIGRMLTALAAAVKKGSH